MADSLIDDVLTKPDAGNAVSDMGGMVETIVTEHTPHTKVLDQVRHNWDQRSGGARVAMIAGATVGAGLVIRGLKHLAQGTDLLPIENQDRSKYGHSIVANRTVSGVVETTAGAALLYISLVSKNKFPAVMAE